MSNDSSNSSLAKVSGHAPWTPFNAVLAVILSFFLSQILASALVGLYPVLRNFSGAQSDNWFNSPWSQFLYVVIAEGLALFVLSRFWRRYKTGVKQALGLSRKPVLKDVAFAILGVIAYFAVFMVVLSAVNTFVTVNTSDKQDVGFEGAKGITTLVLSFVSLVVLPPIVEEITFRGYLFAGFRRKFKPIVATLLTSVFFAMPHLWTGKDGVLLWMAAIDTFSLSLVLCTLREKTSALYSGIFVHAIKNFIAFLALFVFVK